MKLISQMIIIQFIIDQFDRNYCLLEENSNRTL